MRIAINVLIICVSFMVAHTSAQGSTVEHYTAKCKYEDATGKVVFDKTCMVSHGTLLAIKGVRKCNWSFFDVHFTSKARASIWISGEPDKCDTNINGKKAKRPDSGLNGSVYNVILLTEEGELFSLGGRQPDK